MITLKECLEKNIRKKQNRKMSEKHKGKNNPMYGITGKNHHSWKNYAYIKNMGKMKKAFRNMQQDIKEK